MIKGKWTPQMLENEIKKKIIGQDEYIHDLATCLWLHNLRREHFLQTGVEIKKPKPNMLVIGNSGMGKTSAIQAIADLLEIPMVIEDASELTGAGWKGKEVSSIVKDVLDVNKMPNDEINPAKEFSIVVLDEMDKVFLNRQSDPTFSPANNLLKFIEGCYVDYENILMQKCGMKTDNLMFICIGAFNGLENIIKKRLTPRSVGFTTEEKNVYKGRQLLKQATNEDLIKYGLSEQFIGRLPMISVMNVLQKEDYADILTKSEISPILQMNQLLGEEIGVNVSFTKKSIEKISTDAVNSEMGARVLHKTVMSVMKNTLFEMAENVKVNKYIVDYNGREFITKAENGERKTQSLLEKTRVYELSCEEEKTLKEIPLLIKNEDNYTLIGLVCEMFELSADDNFIVEPVIQGIGAFYGYREVQMIKHFILGGLARLNATALMSKTETNVFNLLEMIKELQMKQDPLYILAHEKREIMFLDYLKGCDANEIENIRRNAWYVVKKYGCELASMENSEKEAFEGEEIPYDPDKM